MLWCERLTDRFDKNDQMDITTAYTLLAHRTRYSHATVFLDLVHALTTLIKVFEIEV